MKRTPLRPISKKRQRVNAERAKVLRSAWGDPNTWRCRVKDDPSALALLGTCHGKVHAHELKSRARSGRDENLLDVSGMIPLCDYHNEAVERFPIEAHRLGLTKHSWEN